MSGGLDSSALAYVLKAQGHAVRGVFVDYGQAAAVQEAPAVAAMAAHLSIDVTTLTVGGRHAFGPGELFGRNAFLIHAAVFLAGAHRGLLAIGVHADTPYYDCSPAFVSAMKTLLEEQSGGALSLVAPFLAWHKPQILTYFRDAGLPLEATYSCESGTIPPCGSCASCRDREALGC
jgi:7-cyano-7-deazaguanine synthase